MANLSDKNYRKKGSNTPGHSHEIKDAQKDEKRLKRHRKRLSFDWFFRPQ